MNASMSLVALVAALALAGCASSNDDSIRAEWTDNNHARMTMTHAGGHGQMMGAMEGMSMMGPNGAVPMHMWNGNGTCPMGDVADCQMGGMMQGWMMNAGTHVMDMHAMMVNGSPGMVMVPQGTTMPAHEHANMPMGDYTWKMPGMDDAHARHM